MEVTFTKAGRDTSCGAALDEARVAWIALPPGGSLTLAWPALTLEREGDVLAGFAGALTDVYEQGELASSRDEWD